MQGIGFTDGEGAEKLKPKVNRKRKSPPLSGWRDAVVFQTAGRGWNPCGPLPEELEPWGQLLLFLRWREMESCAPTPPYGPPSAPSQDPPLATLS